MASYALSPASAARLVEKNKATGQWQASGQPALDSLLVRGLLGLASAILNGLSLLHRHPFCRRRSRLRRSGCRAGFRVNRFESFGRGERASVPIAAATAGTATADEQTSMPGGRRLSDGKFKMPLQIADISGRMQSTSAWWRRVIESKSHDSVAYPFDRHLGGRRRFVRRLRQLPSPAAQACLLRGALRNPWLNPHRPSASKADRGAGGSTRSGLPANA